MHKVTQPPRAFIGAGFRWNGNCSPCSTIMTRCDPHKWNRRLHAYRRSVAILLIALACAGYGDTNARAAVRPAHPRVWLTPEKLAVLTARADSGAPQWERLLNHLDTPSSWYRESTLAMSAALACRCLEDSDPGRSAAYADLAVEKMFSVIDRGIPGELDTYKVTVADIAVTFDWLYHALSPDERARVIAFINGAHERAAGQYRNAWVNYNFDIMMIAGISGYATWGDNPEAPALIDHARAVRWDYTRPALAVTGTGGGWAEENGYAMETTSRLPLWMAAVKSATGEDLFDSIEFVYDRLLYELLSLYPNPSDHNGKFYHKHVPAGDGRQGIGPWHHARIGRLASIEAFADRAYAGYAQAWVSRPPANKMGDDWLSVWDFLFFNPDTDSLPLAEAPLACYARGTGTVVMKGDWTPSGTQIHFQGGGPHLEYHQHLDKNSFTIYKMKPLAIDAGTYDGSGDREDHVLNYYKRTVAHNSILVYRPDERWTWQHTWQYKPGTNDGGQRAMSIYTASGKRVGPWVPFNSTGLDHGDWPYNTYRINFDCGSTPRFEHTDDYTYTMGDAARAYPAWRVSNFKRHLVYLRPREPGGDEYIIVYDRVTAADPGWQKYWLLQCPTEPAVAGGEEYRVDAGIMEYRGANLCIIENGGGMLFSRTLLPADPVIRKIGGPPTRDSWVFGTNHHYGESCCYGWGRIEVLPSAPRTDDLFLHVLYPALAGTESMPPAELITGDAIAGAAVGDRVCVFSRTEHALERGAFALDGSGPRRVLLIDLAPGRPYRVSRDGERVTTGTSSANSVLQVDLNLEGRHTISFEMEPAATGGRSR